MPPDPELVAQLRSLQDQVGFPLATLADTVGFAVGIVHLSPPSGNSGVEVLLAAGRSEGRLVAIMFSQRGYSGFGEVQSGDGSTMDTFPVRGGDGLGTITTYNRASDGATLRTLLWQQESATQLLSGIGVSVTYLLIGINVPGARLIEIANSVVPIAVLRAL